MGQVEKMKFKRLHITGCPNQERIKKSIETVKEFPILRELKKAEIMINRCIERLGALRTVMKQMKDEINGVQGECKRNNEGISRQPSVYVFVERPLFATSIKDEKPN
jgi:hypothetical protein